MKYDDGIRSRSSREVRRERDRNRVDPRRPAWPGKIATSPPVGSTFNAVTPITIERLANSSPDYTGAVPTITDAAYTVPVYLMGTRSASTGDMVVVRWADYRWVADVGGVTRITVCVSPTGCISQLTGVTITISSGGTTLGTCTTTSGPFGTANCCIAGIPAGASITITASKTGFADTSVTVAAASSGTQNVSITLNPPDGKKCFGSCCPDPLPDTLYWTDANGSATLYSGSTLYSGLPCATTWVGCYTFFCSNATRQAIPIWNPTQNRSYYGACTNSPSDIPVWVMAYCDVIDGALNLTVCLASPVCPSNSPETVAFWRPCGNWWSGTIMFSEPTWGTDNGATCTSFGASDFATNPGSLESGRFGLMNGSSPYTCGSTILQSITFDNEMYPDLPGGGTLSQ